MISTCLPAYTNGTWQLSYIVQYILSPPYLLHTQIIRPKDPQRQSMPNEQPKQPARQLHSHNLQRQSILAPWTEPDEPEIQNRHVGALHDMPVLISGDAYQVQLMQDFQRRSDEWLWGDPPFGDGGFEEAGAGVEAREAVARTRDEAEELRGGVGEVEELGDEEEQQGLGEVAEDANDGEDHAREVAVGVADEDPGGVAVVAPERQRDADEGEEHVEGE